MGNFKTEGPCERGHRCPLRGGYVKGVGQNSAPPPPRLWEESKYGNKVEITANDVLLGEGTMLVLVNFVQFFFW